MVLDGCSCLVGLEGGVVLDGHLVCATVGAVAFDYSGQFLAYGTPGAVNVAVVKSWDAAATLSNHAKGKSVTALAFAPSAKGLYSTSMDRSVKFFA